MSSGKSHDMVSKKCASGWGVRRQVHDLIDWRKECGNVVDDQEEDDCWLHTSVNCIEGRNCVKTGQYIRLSRKQIIDTCLDFKIDIEGGAFSWCGSIAAVMQGGLVPESAYPKGLRSLPLSAYVKVKGICWVHPYTEAALFDELRRGPIMISLSSYDVDRYRGGILTLNHDIPDHNMVLVGAGINKNGREFWRLKNSYGKQWGEGGYFRVTRNMKAERSIITQDAAFPIMS